MTIIKSDKFLVSLQYKKQSKKAAFFDPIIYEKNRNSSIRNSF
jgi:hypothetical protein